MKIGMIIAVERELKAFIESGKDIKKMIVNNRVILSSNIEGHEVYAIESGCGPIDAACATQLLITKFDVELIVNFGVTGALNKELKVQDLFVVTKTLHYDFDTSSVDDVKMHQYAMYEDEFIPVSKKYVDFVKGIYPDIKEAVVASGGKFIADKKEKEVLEAKGCNICDMEIAAIARTCSLSNIDVLSIKCISDTYDGDGKDFVLNVTRSAKVAFDVLMSLLKEIK